MGGYTLAELIVGLGVMTAVVALFLGLLLAAQHLLPGRSAQVGTDVLPVAPSASAFAEAVRLHGRLVERLATARAVYVLGGSHRGLPPGASRLASLPLRASALPRLAGITRGMPLDAYGFYSTYRAELGEMESAAANSDFSVLVIGPWEEQLALTTLVQSRATRVAAGSGSDPLFYTRRSTVMYDISGDVVQCSFLEPEDVSSSLWQGAVHFWHRYDEGQIAEEGPVLTVFPDPFIYAGARGSPGVDESPPFSRFMYALLINP